VSYPGSEFKMARNGRLTRQKPGRWHARPNGAYKLLTQFLYSSHWTLVYLPGDTVQIRSCAKLARYMGTSSENLYSWLAYLEKMGYIESYARSQNRRAAQFKLRPPHTRTS
jgi:DNA-binding MarR family transcriptional regulator